MTTYEGSSASLSWQPAATSTTTHVGLYSAGPASTAYRIGTDRLVDGWVGQIRVGGVLVWQTPDTYKNSDKAHDAAEAHLTARLAKALA